MSHIDIYTDGSCIKNKKNIACGYGVYFPNGEFSNISRPFNHPPLTNQRTELYAIYTALKIANEFDNITIYSDSEYSIKSLTIWIKNWKKNNWQTAQKKSVLNQDIIKNIDELMHNRVKFIHVKAHTGKQDDMSKNNDIVDKFAKDGAKKHLNFSTNN